MVNFRPIAFFDAPQVLNTAVTPIPASSSLPLQVVANLGFKASQLISFIDTTGNFIGVYIGPPGFEVLNCIVGGGLTGFSYGVIAAHSRVSLRNMSNTTITTGSLTCTFLGY